MNLFLFITDPTLQQLRDSKQQRLSHAFRPGTVLNHKTQFKTYFAFCLKYKLMDLNPTSQSLCLYQEYLANRFKSANSVKNYLSAVGLLHKLLGHTCTALQSHTVHLMSRALDNTMRSPPTIR